MTQSINRFKFIKTAVLWTLLLGIIISSCSKSSSTPPPPPDTSTLSAALTAANALYTGSAEGTKPGEYEVGSRTAFKAVVDAATAVLNNAASTQADITNAVAQLAAATTTYGTHFIKEIAATNLMGFWKFNGNSKDSSGNGNDGVVTAGHAYYGAGMPALTEDRFGRAGMAYHFDKGGNIEIPYTTSLNPQQMTISLWSKKETAGRTINTDTYTLIAMNRWNGYKFQYQSTNKAFYTVKALIAAGDTTIYDRDDDFATLDNDVWYHLVVTYKPGEMNFYINGDLIKSYTPASTTGAVSATATALQLANPINLIIGQDLPTSKYLLVDGDFQVAWGGFFTGDIDDVMFYNVALEGPQVKSIFTNQSTL